MSAPSSTGSNDCSDLIFGLYCLILVLTVGACIILMKILTPCKKMALYSSIPKPPVDFMNTLKHKADTDIHLEKVDLGVGLYRDEQGGYYEFPAIKKAKEILTEKRLGYDVGGFLPVNKYKGVLSRLIIESEKYNPTTGIPPFLRLAAQCILGGSVDLQRVASVQTIGGTGANRIGAVFLQKHFANENTRVYIGTPGWPNHPPLFTHAGLQHETYRYLDAATGCVDTASILSAVETAPQRSIFVLQGCCQNPSGSDFTKKEWQTLAQAFKGKKHLAFFDVAYQGLGTINPDGGMDDVLGVRHFAEQGIDMLVCQSFSKNMGLYSERVGVLHVVCHDSSIAERVKDALRALIRWEFSSASAYGARLVETILENKSLTEEWKRELAGAAKRLVDNREKLYYELVVVRKTPGNWEFLVRDKGLFSLTGLSENQVDSLIERHIYLPWNGRINVAGLNEGNMSRVADAIDSVIRET